MPVPFTLVILYFASSLSWSQDFTTLRFYVSDLSRDRRFSCVLCQLLQPAFPPMLRKQRKM
ncbi:conserved hypothetical protein [Ricinus communis]|uniref:Secreted protein n=1 Tax=Ricinus communis TaxID=3988 RepID=B9T7G0_RICCO|nr:conserved hypothetical protein [Ricinus communis]